MKKYDKILIAIIVLLCVATILNMVLGIMYFESSAYYKKMVWDTKTETYIWNGDFYRGYGFGGCSIASMFSSFIAIILAIYTLVSKKKSKNHLIIITSFITVILAWALCLTAFFTDGIIHAWGDNDINMHFYSKNNDEVGGTAIGFLSAALILSCVYLGLSETARKKATTPQKQAQEALIQASKPTLGIDTGVNELKDLKSLLDSGILTPSEFAVQKSRLLSSMGINVEKEKAEKQPSFKGNYVADNGIIITLNERNFAIRKANSSNALVGTYVTHFNARCITLTRDGGKTMSLQIKDENHLVDSTGNVYVKE